MPSLTDLIAGYEAELISPVDDRVVALVERFIVPNVDAIIRDMSELRGETDAFLRARLGGTAKPDEGGDGGPPGYPVSYCLEITRHMLHLMSRVPAPAHMTGLQAVHDFVRAGGFVKRIWGALRGTYFQNATQVGNYYLDVANDTVNPQKPKVELLPLADANFRNVDSYFEFETVGRSYWQCHTIANRHFPNLAPWYPVVTFSKRGVIRLDSANSFMFPMNIVRGFAPAWDFVMGGEGARTEAEPYADMMARIAEIDPRMQDPDGLLYFSRQPDEQRIEENFARLRTCGQGELEATMQRVLTVDPRLWNVVAAGA